MEIFSYPSLHQTSQLNMSFCSFLWLKTIKHSLNRILLYLWRETHFVIKTYILFEPTDPNSWFLYILVYKSNAIQSEWITILQIITTQKNLLDIFLCYIADTSVYSNRIPTSETWPLHFSILENNQVCDLKCTCDLTWVLHCMYACMKF